MRCFNGEKRRNKKKCCVDTLNFTVNAIESVKKLNCNGKKRYIKTIFMFFRLHLSMWWYIRLKKRSFLLDIQYTLHRKCFWYHSFWVVFIKTWWLLFMKRRKKREMRWRWNEKKMLFYKWASCFNLQQDGKRERAKRKMFYRVRKIVWKFIQSKAQSGKKCCASSGF